MSIDTQGKVSNAQSLLRNQATAHSKEDGELRKDDFMNLFLTQMSNQNPTDPMDSGGMMTQLAQLGSMEQLENLNSGMKSLNNTQSGISRIQSLNLLNKDIFIESNEVELTQGSGKPVFYSLDQNTDNLRVVIESEDGSPVFNEKLGHAYKGKHKFVWDGKSDMGVMMPDGKFKIRFTASKADGTSSNIGIFSQARVSQIDFQNGDAWVKTHNQLIPISKIKSIDNSSERTFGNSRPLPYMKELAPKEMMKMKEQN